MEFDFDKLISVKNVNEAEVGKEYYFFNEIDTYILQGDFSDISKAKLEHIYKDSPSLPFLTNEIRFSFLYPVEEEKHYITYEELKERWLKNPTEIYCYKTEYYDITGMIIAFREKHKIVFIGNQSFSEEPTIENDEFLIKNLTDINGKPLIKEE